MLRESSAVDAAQEVTVFVNRSRGSRLVMPRTTRASRASPPAPPHSTKGGGLDYTGDWRSNSARQVWDRATKKRAFYNARSLKNWLESNGWVDSVSADRDELRSGVLSGAQPGDVVFYDWERSGGYETVHTAIVVAVENGVPIVADQGAGQANSRRQWHQSGNRVGVNHLEFQPDVEAVLMKGKR
jgi:hypothetical protein